jgi:hypothetical protein
MNPDRLSMLAVKEDLWRTTARPITVRARNSRIPRRSFLAEGAGTDPSVPAFNDSPGIPLDILRWFCGTS